VPLDTRGTVVLNRTFLLCVNYILYRSQEDILSSLRKDDTEYYVFILDAFWLLWSFKERHVQDVAFASTKLPQEILDIGIPSYTEWVVPTSKNRISWFNFEVGLSSVASKSGR